MSAVEVFTTLRYINVHLLTYLLTIQTYTHSSLDLFDRFIGTAEQEIVCM